MIPSPLSSAGLLLWAGLCALDQRALGGRQIHQPIVAAVGAGWILGCPERALFIGLWMQLVWSVPAPVGGAILPDTGTAAVSGVVVAAVVPGGIGLAAAILVGLLAAWVSLPWERAVQRANERREEQALEAGGAALARAVRLGLTGPFLRGVACVSGAGLLALAVGRWLGFDRLAPARAPGALEQGWLGAAAGLGLAALFVRFRTEVGWGVLRWVAAGFLLGAAGRTLLLRGGS